MTFRIPICFLAAGSMGLCAYAQVGVRTQPRSVAPAGAPSIFVKALAAAGRSTYAGTRSVEIQQGAVRKVHTEYVVHQGQNSRVWFPTDSPFYGQVIVETASERLHYYPKRNVVEVLPAKKDIAYERLRQWIQHPRGNIRLSSTKGEVVAGRATEIGIISDAKGNVRQRLWIDAQNGTVLRREVLDDVGARTAFFEFNQIDYSPVVHPDDFKINVRGVRVVTIAVKLRALAAANRMLLVSLAPSTGFSLEGVNMMRLQGYSVLHQQYIGPRGPLSLFQVAGNIDLQGIRPNSKRGIQFFGWQMNGRSFALVGSYSLDELRELAQVLGARNGL